jgi:ABC-2 type transport system ATP-binding protein
MIGTSPAVRHDGHPAADVPRAPVVVATAIGKRFDQLDVVADLSFEVERGQIFGIIGPSGSGKTTTLRMLLGVLKPTSGELRVLGRSPHRFRRRERQLIGYMPQLFVLFPELSVMENLHFTASIYGVGWFGRGKRLRSALDFVELWDSRSKTAAQLSAGMQRRLELAATLVHDPELIFLDEPTAGVDPVLRAKFWDHFRRLRDAGRTLIVTTQYVTEAEYCDRVAVLKDGRLLILGTPDELRRTAIDGEVVQVSGPDLDRHAVRAIRAVDGVRRIRRVDDDRLEVTVADADQATPIILERLRAADVGVDAVEEHHPSFDDVFVRLMEADDARSQSPPSSPQ